MAEPIQSKQLSVKGQSLNNLIKQLTPEGIDPKAYYELINSQIMGLDAKGNGRPVEDMLYFLNVAKKLGLDPVLKQIYPVYRWDGRAGKERMIIQTGIDGFRLIAQRSKEYGGQDDAVFTVEEEYNPVTDETVKQLKATVTVYKLRGGQRMPVTASARWNEYAQKTKDGKYMGLWATMPRNQLSKCAESLTLRKAFPQDLSGLYISEELDRDRGDIKSLDLPTPKAIEEKKAKTAKVAETSEQAIENLQQAEAEAKKAVIEAVEQEIDAQDKAAREVLIKGTQQKQAEPVHDIGLGHRASEQKQTELLTNFEEGAK